MSLTSVEQALLLAAYFRGGSQQDRSWTSNSDQVLTLSLFYTGDISDAECQRRFAFRSYIQNLYQESPSDDLGYGTLRDEIDARYQVLAGLVNDHPELIEGGGNWKPPAHPTFTSCRLTAAGLELAGMLVNSFPRKPEFVNWPDKRAAPAES